MTAAVGAGAPTCWICRRKLEHYSDGDGKVHEGCPRCRREIEAMQAQLERLTRGRRRQQAKRPARWCPRCRKQPLVGRARVCAPCRQAEAAAVLAERRRRRELLQIERRAAAVAAHTRVCADCSLPFEHWGKGTPKRCPACRQRAEEAKSERWQRRCASCDATFEHRAPRRPPKRCPACRQAQSGAGRVARGSPGGRARGSAVSAARNRVRSAERRALLQTLQARHPNWSATQLARQLGVSAQRVYQMRMEIKAGKAVAA